jgi:hypothetical protein
MLSGSINQQSGYCHYYHLNQHVLMVPQKIHYLTPHCSSLCLHQSTKRWCALIISSCMLSLRGDETLNIGHFHQDQDTSIQSGSGYHNTNRIRISQYNQDQDITIQSGSGYHNTIRIRIPQYNQDTTIQSRSGYHNKNATMLHCEYAEAPAYILIPSAQLSIRNFRPTISCYCTSSII